VVVHILSANLAVCEVVQPMTTAWVLNHPHLATALSTSDHREMKMKWRRWSEKWRWSRSPATSRPETRVATGVVPTMLCILTEAKKTKTFSLVYCVCWQPLNLYAVLIKASVRQCCLGSKTTWLNFLSSSIWQGAEVGDLFLHNFSTLSNRGGQKI